MEEDLRFLKTIGLAVASQFIWIIPLVVYRWINGRSLTAQGPPPDFSSFRIRAMLVLGVGMTGGLGISGLLAPPFRPILPTLSCLLLASLFLWAFIYADRGGFDQN